MHVSVFVCVCVPICRTEVCRNWKDYFNEQFLTFTIPHKTTRQWNTMERESGLNKASIVLNNKKFRVRIVTGESHVKEYKRHNR